MANYTADDYTQLPYMGPRGNKATIRATFSNIAAINGSAGFANGDTFDICRLPAGALVLEGFVFAGTFALATSTICVGVKYADGTSTGGTTGTAVLVTGTASAITAANTRYQFRFIPFRNDADTIVYGTWLSPGAPTTTGASMHFVIDYIPTGGK